MSVPRPCRVPAAWPLTMFMESFMYLEFFEIQNSRAKIFNSQTGLGRGTGDREPCDRSWGLHHHSCSGFLPRGMESNG